MLRIGWGSVEEGRKRRGRGAREQDWVGKGMEGFSGMGEARHGVVV